MKTTLTLIAFMILGACSSVTHERADRTPSSTRTPYILVIGDSNLAGSYGVALHQDLFEWRQADVLSIAIGGASPRHFMEPLKNLCCSFYVRYSSKSGNGVHVHATGRGAADAMILPEFHSRLSEILQNQRPAMVVITLGSNASPQAPYNALVTMLHDHNPQMPVYWIGPPDSPEIKASVGDTRIQTALAQYPRAPYHFFSSLGVAKILHPGPADSRKWVNGFIRDLKSVPLYLPR